MIGDSDGNAYASSADHFLGNSIQTAENNAPATGSEAPRGTPKEVVPAPSMSPWNLNWSPKHQLQDQPIQEPPKGGELKADAIGNKIRESELPNQLSRNPLSVIKDAAQTNAVGLLGYFAKKYLGDWADPMSRLQTYRDQITKMKFDKAETQDISDKVPRGDWPK